MADPKLIDVFQDMPEIDVFDGIPETTAAPIDVAAPPVDIMAGIPGATAEPPEPEKPKGLVASVRDVVVNEAKKYIKDSTEFGKAFLETLPSGGPGNPRALGNLKVRDAEEWESLGRGAVNVAAAAVPYGKLGVAAARPISNRLIQRVAEAEISSIAALASWSAAQAAVEGESVREAALTGAAAGAVLPAVGPALGAVTRPLAKGAIKLPGALGEHVVAPTAKVVNRLAGRLPEKAAKAVGGVVSRNPVYESTKDFLTHFADRALYTGEYALRKLGQGKVADELMEARTEEHILKGMWQARFEQIAAGMKPAPISTRGERKNLKLMRETFGQMIDSSDEEAARLAAKVPFGDDLLKRREAYKQLRDEIADLAEQYGVTQFDAKTGHLRYFIRRQDWGLPHVYVNLDKMVKPGKLQDKAVAAIQEQYPTITKERAVKILNGLHKRQEAALKAESHEGMGYANLQGRRYNLPGYNLDPYAVLPEYFNHMARRIVNHKRFGVMPEGPVAELGAARLSPRLKDQFPKAFEMLDSIEDPASRRVAERIIQRQIGGVETDYTARKAAKMFQPQAVIKLGLAPISQLSQIGTATTQYGAYRQAATNLFKTITRDPESHVAALRTGAFHETLARQHIAEITGQGTGLSPWVTKSLEKTGFSGADRMAREFGTLQGFSYAQHQAEKMANLLPRRDVAKGLEKAYINRTLAAIEKRFVELGIDPEKIVAQGGVLEQDDLLRAGQKLSTTANFWGDSLSLPEYFRSPWGRVFMQFKSFSYQQAAFLKHAVLDPAVKDGNLAPLARLLAAQGVAGEVIADLRSLASLRERDKEGFARVVDNLGYGAAFGLYYDGLRATTFPGGVGNFILGPGFGDASTIIEGGARSVIRTAKTGDFTLDRKLGKKLIQVAPAFMGPLAPYGSMASPAVQNLVYPPKEN